MKHNQDHLIKEESEENTTSSAGPDSIMVDCKQKSCFVYSHLFLWKRFSLSCILAIVVFLALSYNLSFPVDEDVSTPYKSILFRFHTYGAKGTICTLGITALLYLWFSFFGERTLFRSKSLTAMAVLFGLLNTAALHLFYRNMLPDRSVTATALFVIQAAVLTFLFLLFSRLILWIIEAVGSSFTFFNSPEDSLEMSNSPADNICALEKQSGFIIWYDQHAGVAAFVIILLCWLPWLISYYPASMEWDVYDPILKYLGQKPADNHHPWFYACVVGSAYKLGLAVGDQNIGIFLYTVFRAIIMAAIYARCSAVQQRCGAPRWIPAITTLFFAITPVWGAYAKHAFKDSIAAALFCWFILALVEIARQIHNGKLRFCTCLEYSAAALFAALFRNNTIYVVIPVTIVLICVVLLCRLNLRYSVLLLLGVLLFQCYQCYISNVQHIEPGNAREALSIPFQQTARTVKLHPNQLTEEEQLILQEYFPQNNFWAYDPIISDPIKNNSNEKYQSLGDYIPYMKIWGKMFLRFPYTYLEAFIAHSSGYYAFTPEYTEAQLFGYGDHSNVGMTIFNWVEDGRFEPSFVCHYSEKLAFMRRIMDNWPEIWHQIPLLNLTDTKPLYTWVGVLMAWLFFQRKEYLKLLPVFAWLLMVLSCVASPVNDCFRYFAPAAAAFPALIILQKKGY